MSVEELDALSENKLEELRSTILACNAAMTVSGFIDTSKGAVLTSPHTLELARNKFKANKSKKLSEQVEAAEKAAGAAKQEKM